MEYEFKELYDEVELGDIEKVKEIISNNPDLIYKNDKYGFTIAHAIASTDNIELAILLLNNEIDVNCKNLDGITPIHIVANGEIAELLIEKGANLDAIDIMNNTPLHLHALEGDEKYDILQLLVESGANLNILNHEGQTPLDIAKTRNDKWNIELLKAD